MKRRSKVMMGLVAFGCIPGEAVADLPILVGSDAAADNLLDIDFTTGNGSVIGPLDDDVVAGLAFDPNHHILYGSSTVTDHLLKIDPATGATFVIGAFGVRNFTMHALAYDSINDLLYGAQEKQDGSKGSELYEIDVKTAAASLVGANDVVDFVGGMAFDPINDVMYLSDPADGLLWTIDLTNGSVDLVGSFGVGGSGIAVGLAYHPDVGLVGSHNHFNADIDDELFMIDSATGQASLIGRINAGNVTGLTFTIQSIATFLDIKPGSCPNPLNRSSHGMMPAAILGTDNVDTSQIDVFSVLISRADGVGGSAAPNEGPPGPHSVLEDVGTPFDGEPCDCHELEGDRIVDLLMHFRTQEVVEALELDDLAPGTFVGLTVTGVLLDKTPFSANDCVRLVPAGDMDGDGAVGAMDLIILISSWGSCAECIDCPVDFDGDCSVGPADLLILLANWG